MCSSDLFLLEYNAILNADIETSNFINKSRCYRKGASKNYDQKIIEKIKINYTNGDPLTKFNDLFFLKMSKKKIMAIKEDSTIGYDERILYGLPSNTYQEIPNNKILRRWIYE